MVLYLVKAKKLQMFMKLQFIVNINGLSVLDILQMNMLWDSETIQRCHEMIIKS